MSPTEQDSLHHAINKIVEQRAQMALENNDPINLPDWLDVMVQSMADLILYAAPPEEHGRMLSYAVKSPARDCVCGKQKRRPQMKKVVDIDVPIEGPEFPPGAPEALARGCTCSPGNNKTA